MKSYTAAVRDYPHTTEVKAGRVVPADCPVEFVEVEPINKAFAPMVRELRYDFAELALATFLQAREAGKRISALPLVLHGNFHHRSISRLRGGPARTPADLAGKRVGVRSYTQTTGMWVRGILAGDYGLNSDDVTWVTTEGPHVAEYVEPANVERGSGALLDLLRAGDVEAVLIGPKAMPDGAPVEPMIEDWQTAQQDWHQRYNAVPLNHLLTVRTDLLHDDPAAVRGLYEAFAGQLDAHAVPGPRKVGHGLNDTLVASMELGIRYAREQHLISGEPAVADVFADAVRILDLG